jgi:hypothetical protein
MTLLFALALAVVVPAAATAAPDAGPLNAAGLPLLDARVRYLLAHRGDARFAGPAAIPVSLRFASAPDAATLERASASGVRFHLDDAPVTARAGRKLRAPGAMLASGARVLGGRTVFPADVAWDGIEALASLPGLERIETSWSPQPPQAPLYRTRALVGAESAWNLADPQSRRLLGTGILIADLDSGFDQFHPDMWRDDGPVHAWIDRDASGTLTDGDAADLDDNGVANPGETVRWFDAPGTAPGQAGTQNPAIDHVYVDANGNGVRDYGPPAFTEADPTYGERVLRPRDLDGNGVITPGEPLVELKTCKVRAIYQTDGTTRRAGVDLIGGEGDVYGHGANVASILVGGEPGRRFGGIAPGASLVMADLTYGANPPFVSPFDVRMAWAAAEGADIMMYEDGEWIWLFLDGSSNVEQLINQYAAAGIVQVGAAGNLATGAMHWQGPLGAAVGDSAVATLDIAVGMGVTRGWGQLYWVPRPGETLALELQAPTGERFAVGGAGGTRTLAQYDVWSATDVSPRGTVRADYELTLSAAATRTSIEGLWRFVARRTGAPAASTLTLNAMCLDELSGWSGFSTWTVPALPGTVTWPATADSAIVVAAFDPALGGLNGFSGRGPRVDGRSIIDVAAPGSTTYTGKRRQAAANVPGGYGSFGGTSAALPHVAASCALLLQWLPGATNGQVRSLLRSGATTDIATGAVPNEDWGYGKLNVYRSANLAYAAVPPDAAAGRSVRRPAISPGVPNPFAASTELRYTLPHAGDVAVEVFDLAGRVVAKLAHGRQAAGVHSLRWNGADRAGAPVAAGVYLVQVRLDGETAARNVVRVK